MAPVSWNGCNTIYHRVIRPFVLKHQSQIDSALDKVGEKVDEVAKEGMVISDKINSSKGSIWHSIVFCKALKFVL